MVFDIVNNFRIYNKTCDLLVYGKKIWFYVQNYLFPQNNLLEAKGLKNKIPIKSSPIWDETGLKVYKKYIVM